MEHLRLIPLFACALYTISCGFNSAYAQDEQWAWHRQQYQLAKQALDHHQEKKAQAIVEKLDDYPLKPYLEYHIALNHIGTLSPKRLNNFIQSYPDSPLKESLRSRWLSRLAKQKSWQLFYENYQPPQNDALWCEYQWSKWVLKKPQMSFLKLTEHLARFSKFSRACQKLYRVRVMANAKNRRLTVKAMQIAFDAKNRFLAKTLRKTDQADLKHILNRWLLVDRNPYRITQIKLQTIPNNFRSHLARHGLAKMVRKDPYRTIKALHYLKINQVLSQTDEDRIARAIAHKLAIAGEPSARVWLKKVLAKKPDITLAQLQIKDALRHQRWQEVLNAIAQLPTEQQQLPAWQYWQARALEKTHHTKAALALYRSLASMRHYYGFLASDHLKQPYQVFHLPLFADLKLTDKLKQSAAFKRVSELQALNLERDAALEWEYYLNQLDEPSVNAAAKLADLYHWPALALRASFKSTHKDDITLRFPLAYSKEILYTAQHANIDPAWLFAIIRQESAFAEKAQSPQGALGMMQLMPRTAREIAHKKFHQRINNNQLLQAQQNIQLGTEYVQQLLIQFDNNMILALAAYNAGPNRVKRWLQQNQTTAFDLWIENIPFKETRNYVKNILAFAVVYAHRLGVNPSLMTKA